MSSEVDICNIALISLGAETIRTFDPPEDNKRARVCKVAYPISRDTLLSGYLWSFARKTRELALVDETHPSWTYVYSLPSDCWTPFFISEDRIRTNWEIEGTHLLCNLKPAILRYVRKMTNSEQFSPHFVEALAVLIKAKIAYAIVQDSKLAAAAITQILPAVRNAQEVDARLGNEYRVQDEDPNLDTFVNPDVM